MKDSYSLDADWEGLEKQYRAHYQQYFNIFHRCGLDVLAVRSDTGMMGGELAHEYMYLTPIGRRHPTLVRRLRVLGQRQIATFAKQANPAKHRRARKDRHAQYHHHRGTDHAARHPRTQDRQGALFDGHRRRRSR